MAVKSVSIRIEEEMLKKLAYVADYVLMLMVHLSIIAYLIIHQ